MNTTSTQPAIRIAGMQDAQAIKACIERAYAPLRSALKDLPDVSGGIAEDIADSAVLVAELSGRIAGCAILRLSGKTAHLANIAVDPDVKGKGIGGILIAEVENRARQNGAAEIRLATHAGILSNIALYTHLGWHETERNGNKILMSKEI